MKYFEAALKEVYYGNSVRNYLIALGIIVVGFVAVRIFKSVVNNRLRKLSERTTTNIDDYVIESINRFGIPILYAMVVYFGLQYLVLPERVDNILRIAITVVVTFFTIRFIANTLLLLLKAYIRRKEGGEEKVKQLRGIMIIVNVIIWSVATLSREPAAVLGILAYLLLLQPKLTVLSLLVLPTVVIPVLVFGRKVRRS